VVITASSKTVGGFLASLPSVILIAEDDELLGPALERFLRARGYETHVVRSARAAIDFMLAHEVDVILLDIMMNGDGEMGGLDVAWQAKGKIPIIVFSGADKEEVIRAALRNALLGATYWFSKPLLEDDYSRLIQAIENARLPRFGRPK